MTAHNLFLGPDAQVNHEISLLRAKREKKSLADRASPVPGVFFAVDPEAKVAGQYVTGGDRLLQLQYVTKTTPRWLALHFALGGVDLGSASVFGVVCKSCAPEAATFRICLRSAMAEGFRDVFLPKHAVAYSQTSTHVDLLRLEGLDEVPGKADWRELILFFQTSSAHIDLLDLRVFIV
ncbi:hypothetical protein [Cereibacter sphaeroides]|uniref:hypothetical protein n=1 Tax=Cereibacter sphaeroides TaxID=1063 RepID=UPI001F1A8954|nr:hypothetical protein [Cereibacter sphaeroides]MCE6967240.1 hypothetical protein [Cereibacter sphaeroides]